MARRPRPVGFVTVLIAVLAPGSQSQAVLTNYDDEGGCPLLTVNGGVCGGDGLLYASECLAKAAGTIVVNAGTCANPGSPGATPTNATADGLTPSGGAAAAAAAEDAAPATQASGAALADHPVGRFLLTVAPDDAAATPAASARRATAADIGRFSAEGFVLVGAARLGGFTPGKQAPPTPAEARAEARSRRGTDELEYYRVRVLTREGLVYASATPTRGRARDLETYAAPGDTAARVDASPPGVDPTAAAAPASAAAALAADPATAPAIANASIVDRDAGTQGSGSGPAGWTRITQLSPGLPHTAIGALSGVDVAEYRTTCTATLFASYAAVTAAHCLYEKKTGSAWQAGIFAPHRYCRGPNGTCPNIFYIESPFGTVDVYSFEFISGWRRRMLSKGQVKGASQQPLLWLSDVAVVSLTKDIGARVGTLGFTYQAPSSKAPLRVHVSGYPGETTIFGDRFKLASDCFIQDRPGASFNLKYYPAQTTCTTACPIAERGQSGQPAWTEAVPGQGVIKGILSYGPPTGSCQGSDTYTRLNKVHFQMMRSYVGWSPPSK